MIRRPPRSTLSSSSAASDVYKRQIVMNASPATLVRADGALIERVVDNLVGNALKYTAAPIAVSVSRNGTDAFIEVEDRGPGIAEADRARVFERFVRGATAAGTQGLGLGLAMVTEIARWHGGEASLDVPAGGGSRFRITLPRAAAEPMTGAM